VNEDWSGWSNLPWNGLETRIQKAITVELPALVADVFTDIILQRAIVSLRKASRDELLIEATGLSSLKRHAVKCGQSGLANLFDVVGRCLALAASRSDDSSIDTVLRSYQKHGLRMLEYIASNGEHAVVERRRIREYLGIESKNDSYLTHMLNAFEKCGLIRRLPSKGGSGVRVTLDLEGKELVKAKLRPDWLPVLVELIESHAAFRSVSEAEEVLLRSGFVSAQAASEIASALQVARHKRSDLSFDKQLQMARTEAEQSKHWNIFSSFDLLTSERSRSESSKIDFSLHTHSTKLPLQNISKKVTIQ